MKVLDQRDLTLMNISLEVEFSGLTLVEQFSYASVLTYMLLILSLFIPIGLIISELNARMPCEGGFYFWNCNAFGDSHGFISAWSY